MGPQALPTPPNSTARTRVGATRMHGLWAQRAFLSSLAARAVLHAMLPCRVCAAAWPRSVAHTVLKTKAHLLSARCSISQLALQPISIAHARRPPTSTDSDNPAQLPCHPPPTTSAPACCHVVNT